MITADQIVAHLVGDFVLQSDWIAQNKNGKSFATLVHVSLYILPFLLITTNPLTLLVIGGTHFVIDRWRLARWVVWARSRPFPGSKSWAECRETGFAPGMPAYLSSLLLIIVDNTMHILINGAAITWIG